jgi:hypothetical protein
LEKLPHYQSVGVAVSKKFPALLICSCGFPQRGLFRVLRSFLRALSSRFSILNLALILPAVDIYGHLVPGGNRQAVNKLDDGLEIPDQTSRGNKMETF